MKIGVFDSGVGGKSVALAIQKQLPGHQVVFRNDVKNVPYGNKTPQELLELVLPILKDLQSSVDVIVIACNTVSTTLISKLRELLDVPLIAIEPMVKPACETTKSKVIAVCATPTTLKSKRYNELKSLYGAGIKILEPDCSDWSFMIESNSVDHHKINNRITEVCQLGADVIVLACTHYHWIEDEIKQIADKYSTEVIQPEQAIIRQLKRVLRQLG